MKNYRYMLDKQFEARKIAEDLQLQLAINRFDEVKVRAVDLRNEVLVQVPEASDVSLEVAVNSFMENYQTGVILE